MCETTAMIKYAGYEFGTNLLNLRRKCVTDKRLDGKVVVVTGANSGIGKETALQLSLRGAKVYIACRSLDKAEEAVKDIVNKNPEADINIMKLDLSSLKSVREFVQQFKDKEQVIDILVNNAGVFGCPEWQTTDGFEMQFGTNYLGPFLLTLLLLPLLKKSSNARIVNVASAYHKVGGKINFDNINLRDGAYDPIKAYTQSKLAQILFTQELAKRLGEQSNVKVYALNPGAVKSDMQRHQKFNETMMNATMLTPEMGCQTSLYCALDETLDNETGQYYDNCKREKLGKVATNEETAHKLWDSSVQMVDLEDHLKI